MRQVWRQSLNRIASICLCLLPLAAQAEIKSATYTDQTTRYSHAILGDALEWGALRLQLSDGSAIKLTLPESRVFEDLTPRLVDVDLDGDAEVISIETSLTQGARLSIYDETGLVAATPYIGRTHRWLAPIGAADLDGDGLIEIAYIDRPHLAKTLLVWRVSNGELVEVAAKAGLTNHRIGWDIIPGGIRDCGDGPEMITASGAWTHIVTTRLNINGQLTSKELAPYEGPESLDAAVNCP